MDVSVIVCTYNGSGTIIRCLSALTLQDTSLSFEVIIIDNNSKDGTYNLVDEYIRSNNLTNFKLSFESKRGKVNALKKGILDSSGEVIIICDDDNMLSPNYTSTAFELISRNENIGLACGINHAKFDGDKPEWFDEYSLLYACGTLMTSSGILNQDLIVWGAGMVCRGELIRELYRCGIVHFTSAEFERDGLRKGGEDNELCCWIRFLGFDLYFSDRLNLEHIMTNDRLAIESREKLELGMRVGVVSLKKNLRIMFKSTQKFSKRDFINFFLLNDDGYISRLKLGFYGKNNHYSANMAKLLNLKSKYSVK